MKNIKSILALILAVMMIFTLTACNGSSDETATPDEASTSDEAVIAKPDPVDIGKCTVEFLRVEKYVPFEDGESLLVYFKFTNNDKVETSAFKQVYITAKCGEKRLLEMAYQPEFTPEGYDNYEQMVAPGESIELVYVLGYADGLVEISLQSLMDASADKLVFSVDTKTL